MDNDPSKRPTILNMSTEEVFEGVGEETLGVHQDYTDMQDTRQIATQFFQQWDPASSGVMRVSTIMSALQRTTYDDQVISALEAILDPTNDDPTIDQDAFNKAVEYVANLKREELDVPQLDRTAVCLDPEPDNHMIELRHQRIKDQQEITRLMTQLDSSDEKQNALYADISLLKENNYRQKLELKQVYEDKKVREELQAELNVKDSRISVLEQALKREQIKVASLSEPNTRLAEFEKCRVKLEEFRKIKDESEVKMKEKNEQIRILTSALESCDNKLKIVTNDREKLTQLNDHLLLKIETLKHDKEQLSEKTAMLNYKLLMKKQIVQENLVEVESNQVVYREEMASTSPPFFPSPTLNDSLHAEISSAIKYVTHAPAESHSISTQTLEHPRQDVLTTKRKLILEESHLIKSATLLPKRAHLQLDQLFPLKEEIEDQIQVGVSLSDIHSSSTQTESVLLTTSEVQGGISLSDIQSSSSQTESVIFKTSEVQVGVSLCNIQSSSCQTESVILTTSEVQVGVSLSDIQSSTSQTESVIFKTAEVQAGVSLSDVQSSWCQTESVILTTSEVQVGVSLSDIQSSTSQTESVIFKTAEVQAGVSLSDVQSSWCQTESVISTTSEVQVGVSLSDIQSSTSQTESVIFTTSEVQAGVSLSDVRSSSCQTESVILTTSEVQAGVSLSNIQSSSCQTESVILATVENVELPSNTVASTSSWYSWIFFVIFWWFGVFCGSVMLSFMFAWLVFTGIINDVVVENVLIQNGFTWKGLPPM